jgi:hypothetical protein
METRMSERLQNNANLDIWSENSSTRHCPEFCPKGLNKITLYFKFGQSLSLPRYKPVTPVSDLKKLVRLR